MRGIVASTLTGLIAHVLLLPPWRGGRVAECTGLENRRRETVRGFKSHLFRFLLTKQMKINLWFCNEMQYWRWTLIDDIKPSIQESGQQPVLRDAMNDVANTVEYILDCRGD